MLFQEMAEASGVGCAKLITAYMQRGAPVFGEVPATGLYEGEHSGPDKTFKQVLQAAKWSKPAMKAKVKGDVNPEVDKGLCADGSGGKGGQGRGPVHGGGGRRHLGHALGAGEKSRPGAILRHPAHR